jgi:large subunit ribosomal protein L4e
MTKINVLDLKGSKIRDVDTSIFSGLVRKDIVQRIMEVEKYYDKQVYAPYYLSGNQTSASGFVKHNRHVWKTDRGKGQSRIPKKRMSDKGDRFAFVGAVIPGTRGGRRAHPPKLIRANIGYNKKEFILGLLSCLALSSSATFANEKYATLADKKITAKLPIVFDSNVLTAKTKDFYATLKTLLGEDLFSVAIQTKSQRPGKGKARGRRYKQNAGLLLVLGNDEKMKISGIELVKAKDLKLKDFGVSGRLVAFTENAVKVLEKRIYGQTTEEKEKAKEVKK